MKKRESITTGSWAILMSFAFSVHAAKPIDTWSYMQYDVKNLQTPVGQDCAAKHSKYLKSIKQRNNGEFQISSISEDSKFRNRSTSGKGYVKLSRNYVVPDVNLISHEGERKKILDVLNGDKPVMLNFIFTTCTTICPVLAATFTGVQELLGDERDQISMISITIDPEYDTAAKLSDYSKRYDAGPQWVFFTGKLNDVIAVEKAFDIYHGSKVNHEPVTLMRTNRDKPWLRLDGLASANDILNEYRELLEE